MATMKSSLNWPWRRSATAKPATRPPRRAQPPGATVFLIVAVCFAGLAGMVMGLGSFPLTILIVGIIVAPAVLLMPATGLISLLLILSVVVAGCLEYFLRVSQAHWIPSLLLAAMLVRVPLDALRPAPLVQGSSRISLIGLLIGTFIAIVFAAALVNLAPVMQSLVGLKHYIFPLALVAAVAQSRIGRQYWLALLKGVPWLMLLQMPVCIYQYVFVEKAHAATTMRAGAISWDAVVGTFGGNPDGGGASGALALFLCFGLVAVMALRRSAEISAALARASYVAIAVSMLLAEIKVVIVFLPLAILVYQRKRILKSFFSASIWALGTGLFVLTLFSAYNLIHWQIASDKPLDIEGMFSYVFKAEEDSRMYNDMTGEVSRGGALLLWADEQTSAGASPSEALVGNGPASSKYSSLYGNGTAASRHAFTLTTSAITMMLWDIGLLGVLVFLGIAGVAFLRGLALSEAFESDPAMLAVSESVLVALALVGAGLFYNNDGVNQPAVQVLLALCIGLVLVLDRQCLPQKSAVDPAGPRHDVRATAQAPVSAS